MDTRTLPLGILAAAVLMAGCADRLGPGSPGSPGGLHAGVHTVRRGETLSSVARRYGVSATKLARDNGLADPDRLEVGQRLRVLGAHVGGGQPASGGPGAVKVEPPPRPVPRPAGPVKATGRFVWPVTGRVVGSYCRAVDGSRSHGIAVAAARGSTVKASDSGRVVLACEHMRGYGKVVVVDHGNGYTTAYAHNSALLVREGEYVRQGQAIARVGSTGRATRDQLGFRLYRNGAPLNPLWRLR